MNTFITKVSGGEVEVRVQEYTEYEPATFSMPAEGEFEYTLHCQKTGEQLDLQPTADEDVVLLAEYQAHCEKMEASSYD